MPASIVGNSISAGEFASGNCSGCCTGTGTEPTLCDCLCCPDGFWTRWTFTVVVTSAGTIPPCPEACDITRAAADSGTFTLHKRVGCSWTTNEVHSAEPEGCDLAPGPYWSLSCDGTYWRLTNTINSSALYRADLASYPCDDDIVFGYDPAYTPNACTTYSVTVTLSPAGAFVPCP